MPSELPRYVASFIVRSKDLTAQYALASTQRGAYLALGFMDLVIGYRSSGSGFTGLGIVEIQFQSEKPTPRPLIDPFKGTTRKPPTPKAVNPKSLQTLNLNCPKPSTLNPQPTLP